MNRPNVLKLSIISGALGALALAACAPSIPPATSTSPAPSANSAAAPAAPATPAAAAAAPTSAPVAAAKPSGTPQPVRIAYQRGGLPVIAKARGELEKSLSQQGIKLEWVGPFPDAPSGFEALRSKSADFFSSAASPAISALSGEAPVKIVAASQSSSDGRAFLVSKDSTVKNLNDLIGKKVAVQRGNVAEYTFLKTLEKRNIAKDKIERVYIAPQDAAVALAQSKVDAWVTWDPYISIAETQNGAKVIHNGGDAPDFGVWTSLDDFVKSKPELASAVISALAKEGAWANANAKDALGIIAKELNLPAEVADRMATRPSNCTIIGIDDKVAGEIQLTADWLKENSVIPNAVDLNKSVVRNLVK